MTTPPKVICITYTGPCESMAHMETTDPPTYELGGTEPPVEIAPNLYVPGGRTESNGIGWNDEPEPDNPDDPADYTADVMYWFTVELKAYRYRLVRFEAESDRDEGITMQSLRNFPVQTALAWWATTQGCEKRSDGWHRFWINDDRSELAELGPTDDVLREVARVYALGYVAGDKPTGHVQQSFGLKRSTADNWVRRAKDRGYVYAAS